MASEGVVTDLAFERARAALKRIRDDVRAMRRELGDDVSDGDDAA